jgi:hypothetical protein
MSERVNAMSYYSGADYASSRVEELKSKRDKALQSFLPLFTLNLRLKSEVDRIIVDLRNLSRPSLFQLQTTVLSRARGHF